MKLLCCLCLILSLAVWCEAKAWPVAGPGPQNNALSFLEGVVAGEILEAEIQAGGGNNGYGGGYNSGYGYGNGYGNGYNNYNYGR
jgi:hypothetical protein